MSEQDSNRTRSRIVPAPPPSTPRLHSTVLSVECAENASYRAIVWCRAYRTSGREFLEKRRHDDRSLPTTGDSAIILANRFSADLEKP
jgi:hypothetical protein